MILLSKPLELLIVKDLIDEALKDNDVQEFLQTALPLIQAENWQKLVQLLEGVFKVLIAKRFLENYAEKVESEWPFVWACGVFQFWDGFTLWQHFYLP